MMTNADVGRIINSDEVQRVLRPKRLPIKHPRLKKNPLKNDLVMFRLNPYAKTLKRKAILAGLKQKTKTVKPKETAEEKDKPAEPKKPEAAEAKKKVEKEAPKK